MQKHTSYSEDIEQYIKNFSNKLSQHSNFITEKECADIIHTAFKKCIMDDKLEDGAEMVQYHGALGVKWNLGKHELKDEIIKEICNLIKYKKRQKIRGILRTTYLLIKAYRGTKEKLYHPDSEYVNAILKSNFNELKLKLQ